MTADEAWDKIVSRVEKNRDVLEEKVEEIWGDTIFSILLGYDDDDVLHQVPVQMGKETKRLDILVKEDRKNIFVVEFKRHYSAFDDHDKKQLFSYMRLLEPPVKVGILICKELYIYYDVPEKPLEMKIPFEHGNPQGSKFIDLFRKGNFDENAVKASIEQQQTLQSDIQAIRADVQNVSKIIAIIKDYYVSSYSEETVGIALKDLHLSLSLGEEKKTPNTKPVTGIPKLPIMKLANDSPVKKTYKAFLIERGYKQNVANSYASGISTVLKWEHLTWEELLQKITDIRQQYEPGNVKEDFGKYNHSTVLNALRRFDEFTNAEN